MLQLQLLLSHSALLLHSPPSLVPTPLPSPALPSSHPPTLSSPFPPGKYLLLKDPNKDLLRLYAVPADAFEAHYTDEPLPESAVEAAPSAATTRKAGDDD